MKRIVWTEEEVRQYKEALQSMVDQGYSQREWMVKAQEHLPPKRRRSYTHALVKLTEKLLAGKEEMEIPLDTIPGNSMPTKPKSYKPAAKQLTKPEMVLEIIRLVIALAKT